MKNNLITKILELLQEEKNRELFPAIITIQDSISTPDCQEIEPLFTLGESTLRFWWQLPEYKLQYILLTAFATLDYFTKKTVKWNYTLKLSTSLSHTLVDNFNNPNWLEKLEEVYNQNV